MEHSSDAIYKIDSYSRDHKVLRSFFLRWFYSLETDQNPEIRSKVGEIKSQIAYSNFIYFKNFTIQEFIIDFKKLKNS